MSNALDLPLEAFYLQDQHWLSDEDACARLLAKFPQASKSEVEDAVKRARILSSLTGRGDFYFEPDVDAVTAKAMPYLQKGAPGLSDRAYAAALNRILYSWMK
jgi:hypothetical protein